MALNKIAKRWTMNRKMVILMTIMIMVMIMMIMLMIMAMIIMTTTMMISIIIIIIIIISVGGTNIDLIRNDKIFNYYIHFFFILLSYIPVNRFSPLISFTIVSKQIASYKLPVSREVYNCRF